MRRKRQRPDRGINRVFAANDRVYRKIQSALIEYDKGVSQIEREWGFERLPELVSPELRERFEAQMDQLDAAIRADDIDGVETQSGGALRAYQALVAEARALGHAPLSGDHYATETPDGRAFCIASTPAEAGRVKSERPDAIVYSAREVAAIVALFEDGELVQAVKEAFPGATIAAITDKGEVPSDEIPF